MHKHGSWRVWGLVIVLLAAASLACSLSRNSSDTTAEDIDTRPLVALIAPVNGSTYAEGAIVQLYAIAQDSLSGVTRIEFRVDDAPVGEVTSPQPEGQASLEGIVQWTATGGTGHLITVEGFRANGSSLGLSDAAVRVAARPAEQATANALGLDTSSADNTPAPAPDLPSPEPTTGQPVPQATSQPTSPPANTPEAPAAPAAASGIPATVNTAELYVRQGPGTAYPTVGILHQGDTIQIVGRNADSSWWAVSYESGTAWVFAGLTSPQGDVSQVPLVAAPALTQ